MVLSAEIKQGSPVAVPSQLHDHQYQGPKGPWPRLLLPLPSPWGFRSHLSQLVFVSTALGRGKRAACDSFGQVTLTPGGPFSVP